MNYVIIIIIIIIIIFIITWKVASDILQVVYTQ